MIGHFLSLALAAAQPAEPGTISRMELSRMTPEAVARRLFGDLAAVIAPLDFESWQPPDRPLRSLTLRTRGVSSARYGICRSNRIYVSFTIAGPNRGADTRVRPRSISTTDQFFILETQAQQEGGPASWAAYDQADTACRAADLRQVRLIYAPHEFDLGDALRTLGRVTAAARVGAPLLLACIALLASANARRVASVDPCRPPSPGRCYAISVDVDVPAGWEGGAEIRIELAGGTDAVASVAVSRRPPPVPIVAMD